MRIRKAYTPFVGPSGDQLGVKVKFPGGCDELKQKKLLLCWDSTPKAGSCPLLYLKPVQMRPSGIAMDIVQRPGNSIASRLLRDGNSSSRPLRRWRHVRSQPPRRPCLSFRRQRSAVSPSDCPRRAYPPDTGSAFRRKMRQSPPRAGAQPVWAPSEVMRAHAEPSQIDSLARSTSIRASRR